VAQKPSHPDALRTQNNTAAAFDRWLSLFYHWVAATIDGILAAFATTEFITSSPSDALGAERVTTSSGSITVNTGTVGQITWELNTEYAQDLVAGMMADSDTIDASYNDLAGLLTYDVRTQGSIDSDVNGIKLDGDDPAPGNNKVYGTDAAGVKGWQTASASLMSDGNGMAFAARHG
jgi:hypothetical protein